MLHFKSSNSIFSLWLFSATLCFDTPAVGTDLLIDTNEEYLSTSSVQEESSINLDIDESSLNEDYPLLSLTHEFLIEQNDNPLVSYIRNYVISDEKVKESACAKVMRLGAKGFAILYGATGGIPYINACCEAAKGNDFLCATFATANVISSGGATIWAGLRIMNYFDPLSTEEEKILNSTTTCSVLKHIACNVLGMLSCIPGTYAVYKYNPGILGFLAIPGFLNNYIFSTSGYYEITNPESMFQKFINKFRKEDESVINSDGIKKQLIDQIKNHVIPVIVNDKASKNRLFMENPIEINNENSPHIFMEELLSLNCFPNTIESPEEWKGGYPRKIAQGIGLVFPIGNGIVNYLLGYEAASLLVDSPLLCNSFSGLVVVPLFMLDLLSNTTTMGNLFDVIYNKSRGRNSSTFLSSFYPKLNVVIPVASVTLAALSVTGGWVVSQEAVLNSSLSFLSFALPAVVFVENTISQSFQMRDLLGDTISYFSTFLKSDVGEMAQKVSKLERLSSLVSNCIPSMLIDFWDLLDFSD